MRRTVVLLALATLAGCGHNKTERLPAACSEGPLAITQALQKAPGAVLIKDQTPISRCFNRNASGNDIQVLGTDMLAAAQRLHDDAQQGAPGAALQLGYLIGAAQRGAKRNGLGDELVRRLEAESGGLGSARSEYERGLRAGMARG